MRKNSRQNPFSFIASKIQDGISPQNIFSPKTTKIEYMCLYDYTLKREKKRASIMMDDLNYK